MTLGNPRPRRDLRQEGEEEALSVLRIGSSQELAASRWAEEGAAPPGCEAELDHGC